VSGEVRYVRTAAALWRRVGGEVLLAAPEGSEVERLSLPASAAWQLLDRPRTTAELTELLADEFATPRDEIGGRVLALLEELEAGGWLVRVGRERASARDA
jgi:hypothetical protein